MLQFCRDGFIDRYSGQKLVNPGMIRAFSHYFPEEFPFHKNWKMSECHIAYWEFIPTVDHIVPIALGGADNETNWASTSKEIDIGIYTTDFENEFISLTDIARYKSNNLNDTIKNWMKGRETLEFLGLWEKLHNPDFKPVEFDGFRNQAGLHAFTMSPTKWIEGVNAIGLISKAGRYGGTYAHSDIAFEFASWISAEFKLYIIKDYHRLKKDENSRLSLNWNLNREISKLNYRIHTDAIKENLIPSNLTPEQISYKYANEAYFLYQKGSQEVRSKKELSHEFH